MKRKSLTLSNPDFFALLCAFVLGVAFTFLPWQRSILGINPSGSSLLFEALTAVQTNVSILWFIQLASIISLLASLWGFFRISSRHTTSIVNCLAGLVGLISYAIFLVQNNQTQTDGTTAIGSGFWIGLVACIGLILQIFLPRPVAAKKEVSKRASWFAWYWLILAALYLLVPLVATLQFSLQSQKSVPISFAAYTSALAAPQFVSSFLFSLRTALITILVSVVLIVPTAYWVNLRLPRLRSVIEFLTLLPFVIPPVVLVFALIRSYNGTSLTDSSQGVYIIMVGAYVMLSFPFNYRAVDTGLQSLNIRALTEAAQSLGAGWFTILFRVVFPNIYLAVLNGAFVTFALVMGEFTIAALLSQPTFGPYMNQIAARQVYQPSALAILSFALTWGCIIVIQQLGKRRGNQVKAVTFR